MEKRRKEIHGMENNFLLCGEAKKRDTWHGKQYGQRHRDMGKQGAAETWASMVLLDASLARLTGADLRRALYIQDFGLYSLEMVVVEGATCWQ